MSEYNSSTLETVDNLRQSLSIAARRGAGIQSLPRWKRLAYFPLRVGFPYALKRACDAGFPVEVRKRVRLFTGDHMTVVLPDDVATALHVYGYFERELTDALLRLICPGMNVFDIGAHVGYFTILSSRLVGSAGEVHAFEPTPKTCDLLRSNARRFSNVSIHECALWSSADPVTLHDFGEEYSAYNTLYRQSRGDGRLMRRTLRVKATTVDDHVRESGVVPDFLKIDAESSEGEILKGMAHTLETHRPMVSLEVGDFGVQGVSTSKELIEWVMAWDFVPFRCTNFGLVCHTPQGSYPYENIVFVPAEKLNSVKLNSWTEGRVDDS